MCGRYASFLPAEAIARIFGTVNPLPNLETTWNMAPTRDAPVVRLSKDGQRHLDALKLELTRIGGALQAFRGGFRDAEDTTAVFP